MLNCPFMKCEVSVARSQIKKHAKKCKYRPFNCPHCGHKGVYIEVVEIHYQNCTEYPVACPKNCSTKIKRSELQCHVDMACPNTMVCCPFLDLGCKAKTKRSELKKHIDSNAGQHRFLVSSTISELRKENKSQKESQSNLLGATGLLESKVSTLENKCSKLEGDLFSMLHIHEENEAKRSKAVAELGEKNTILESSLSTLSSQYAKLKNNLSATCKENKQLKGTLSVLELKCTSLQTQFGKLKSQMTNATQQVTAKENKMKKLYDNCVAKMTAIEEQITSTIPHANVDKGEYSDDSYLSNCYRKLENSLQAVEEENTELKASLSVLGRKYWNLEKMLSDLQDHVCNSDQEVTSAKQNLLHLLQQFETQAVGPPPQQQQNRNNDYWIHDYRLIAETMKKHNWTLYLKTMAETSTQFPEPVSPVIMKVEGYVKANNSTLFTSHFFTSGSGKYKFQLAISVSYDKTAVPYMSVYARLLKGEYDSSLSWPFVGSIYVTLLNQADNTDHYRMSIWLLESGASFEGGGRVRSGQDNSLLYGQPYFISHYELETTKQYVMNNSLYFNVEATAATKAKNSKDCILS
ncbi:TNF receptor-associated factor 5-like [Dysidea avara]|uniref:TNF receptor-associated factor 5-like n=1 Tax=Dysidea avara TaxID=196820 RepID=UPI003327EBB4